MVIVSCSTKFWAFNLAEELNKYEQLTALYSTYSYQKNIWMRKFVSRIDKEVVPVEKIHTHIPLAVAIKGYPKPFIWNDLFDKWVASKISKREDFKIFIGWAGISLHSIRAAKQKGKITILERGSSHIEYQNKILKEEFKKFDIDFSIDSRVIDKELQEYEEADYIGVPSNFVKNSFLEAGFSDSKIILNNFGTSSFFQYQEPKNKPNKFILLYLGPLIVRKGLIYLFDAIKALNIPKENFEFWVIGGVSNDLKGLVEERKQDNWKLFGHVNHYDLPKYLSQCDVAVHPSVEEGLSMVIPQMMACKVPVIATTNTGGMDIIEDGKNGFIVPIRTPKAITEKIELLYNQPKLLAKVKENTLKTGRYTWEAYGKRYSEFIKSLGN